MALVDELEQRVERSLRACGAAAVRPSRGSWSNSGTSPVSEAQVEQRQQELGVVGIRARVEVGQLADVLADGQLQIPERLQDGVHEALFAAPIGPSKTMSRSMSEWRQSVRRP